MPASREAPVCVWGRGGSCTRRQPSCPSHALRGALRSRADPRYPPCWWTCPVPGTDSESPHLQLGTPRRPTAPHQTSIPPGPGSFSGAAHLQAPCPWVRTVPPQPETPPQPHSRPFTCFSYVAWGGEGAPGRGKGGREAWQAVGGLWPDVPTLAVVVHPSGTLKPSACSVKRPAQS